MSSTLMLAAGMKFQFDDLRSNWLKMNVDSGHQVHCSQSTYGPKKARFFSVCYTAPKVGWKAATNTCRAHVNAVGDSPDEMYIKSVNLTHTCGNVPENEQRKRNYLTRHIGKMSDAIKQWQPAKSGNAQQFSLIAKNTTGIDIKGGQANRTVRSKSNDLTEIHIAQYFWLPSVMEVYKQEDPTGTYVLEWTPCQWNRSLCQFSRAYVCLSIAKHLWEHAIIRMAVCDGTFTRSNSFKQTILIATTYNPNNQIVVLSVATVDCENSDNWIWFKEHLEADFAGAVPWFSPSRGWSQTGFK
jgi:hypothetical protein